MVSVTKTSQITRGDVYWIRGNATSGNPIPPQLFQVKTAVMRDGVMGRPYVKGTLAMHLGDIGMRVLDDTVLFLESVGVYDTGWSQVDEWNKLGRFREHDRHLERIPDHVTNLFAPLKAMNGYHEIARSGRRGT